jgi:hypothetical protein
MRPKLRLRFRLQLRLRLRPRFRRRAAATPARPHPACDPGGGAALTSIPISVLIAHRGLP